ncbi:hypothetical protein [Bradyrhizobium ganzhouense]|uniref:hypothetical protein n=1 Tax=Bradyrhizobium ganzhouense TaxID=1179767 RepID=UPI003CF49AC6
MKNRVSGPGDDGQLLATQIRNDVLEEDRGEAMNVQDRQVDLFSEVAGTGQRLSRVRRRRKVSDLTAAESRLQHPPEEVVHPGGDLFAHVG